MRHVAIFMAWLLAALTGVAFVLAWLLPGHLMSSFVVVLAVPLVAIITLILIPWSGYRAIYEIAVAMMLLGATSVLVSLFPSVSRVIIPGDSMGLGRMMLMAVGIVMLVWGMFTALPASSARSEAREGHAVGRVLAIMTAVPSLILMALAVVVLV